MLWSSAPQGEGQADDRDRAWPPLGEHDPGPDALIGAGAQYAGEAILLWDAETGAVVAANDTACRWLESTREDLVGRAVSSIGPALAPTLPAVSQPFVDTRGASRPLVIEGTHVTSEGRRFRVDTAITRVTVGGKVCILAVARDAERRAYAADALRDIEGRYRSLFERGSDAVFVAARSGQIVDANDAAATLFGRTRDELAALNARQLFRLRRAEDILRFQRVAVGEGNTVDAEITILHKDGARFPGTISAMPLRGPGKVLRGYQCVVRPVQRERSEMLREVRSERPIATPVSSPATPPAPMPARTVSSDPPGERSRPGVSRATRVLAVANDEAGESEVRGILERAGIAVVTRRHGGWQDEEIAAVVIQITPGQPVMAGTVSSGPPAVVIGEESELATGKRLGFASVTFLPRPIHPLALIQEVRRLLPG